MITSRTHLNLTEEIHKKVVKWAQNNSEKRVLYDLSEVFTMSLAIQGNYTAGKIATRRAAYSCQVYVDFNKGLNAAGVPSIKLDQNSPAVYQIEGGCSRGKPWEPIRQVIYESGPMLRIGEPIRQVIYESGPRF